MRIEKKKWNREKTVNSYNCLELTRASRERRSCNISACEKGKGAVVGICSSSLISIWINELKRVARAKQLNHLLWVHGYIQALTIWNLVWPVIGNDAIHYFKQETQIHNSVYHSMQILHRTMFDNSHSFVI